MKYYFKEFLKLPTLDFSSVEDKNKMGISMFTLGKLYELSFTNQRAYFNTIDSLTENNELENIEIFSIESTDDEYDFTVSGFQRRTQILRLKSIAEYLITKGEEIEFFGEDEDILCLYLQNLGNKSIFPNNVIVSLNNELQYSSENFIHNLYLKEGVAKNEDYTEFKDKLLSLGSLNNEGEILLHNLDGENNDDNNYSQLCFFKGNFLYIPIFKLDENITDEELKDFAINSPLYSNIYNKITLEKVKEYEKFYKISWIIDGQHRTMSLRYLDEVLNKIEDKVKKYLNNINKTELISFFSKETIKSNIYNKSIAVTSFVNSTLGEQADIFLEINNNAKPVDKSLTYDLLPLTAQGITIELATKSLFDKFNQTHNSPLYKVLFNIRGFKKEGGDNILSQANFINEVKYYLKETKKKDRIFFKYYDRKKLTPVYWLMYSFFEKINILYSETIFKGGFYNDKEFLLYRTTGFGALLQLMVLILNFIDINFDNYNEDSYKDSINDINKKFDLYINRLSGKIKFSRSELSNFRGKGGQRDLFIVLSIMVGLDNIENYNGEEKEKIINQLELFKF